MLTDGDLQRPARATVRHHAAKPRPGQGLRQRRPQQNWRWAAKMYLILYRNYVIDIASKFATKSLIF